MHSKKLLKNNNDVTFFLSQICHYFQYFDAQKKMNTYTQIAWFFQKKNSIQIELFYK